MSRCVTLCHCVAWQLLPDREEGSAEGYLHRQVEDKSLLDLEELHSSSTYPVCPPHLRQEAAESTTHFINTFTLKDTINVFSNPCAGTYIYLVCSQSWLRTQWWVLSSKSHLSSRKHTRWNDNKNFESSKMSAVCRSCLAL